MKKFITTNYKDIVITMALSCTISYLGGFTRDYKAIGGEDLFILISLIYWLIKYINIKKKGIRR